MEETIKRQRVVLCRGQYCNLDRRADKLYNQLQTLLTEINGDSYPPRVKIEIANCLSMCGAGPNLIIYPDKTVCNRVDDQELARIVEEYLKVSS